MDFKTFQETIAEIRNRKPILFALEHDEIPTDDEMKYMQSANQIHLPQKYLTFITHYGGGYFGYANMYSLDSKSPFYLFRNNLPSIQGYCFMADNECGDYDAFRVEDGDCQDRIYFYDHNDCSISETTYADIFEYLISCGITA